MLPVLLCCWLARTHDSLPKFLPRFCRLIRANHSGGYYTRKQKETADGTRFGPREKRESRAGGGVPLVPVPWLFLGADFF